MSEREKYKPEDVLVTEGMDKGRIKDVELAQVGAEAEAEAKKPGYWTEETMRKEAMIKGVTPEEWRRSAESKIGTSAMAGEVAKRKSKEIGKEGFTEEGNKAANEFWNESNQLENERKIEADGNE